jgi:CENP-B-like protein
MGSRIPSPIKVEVIRKWLDGKSREQIVKEIGIGAGTVSTIVKESRQNDPTFDLMREVGVKLNRQGDSVETFAPLIRCRELLRKIEGLKVNTKHGEDVGNYKQPHLQQQDIAKGEEKMEALIVALEVFCFKQNLQIKEFIDLVYNLYSTADRLDVRLENLPSYVVELEKDLQRLTKEVQGIKWQKQQALLEEFELSKPLIARNQELKEELNAMTLEIKRLRTELKRKRVSNVIDEYEMAISEEELEEVNKEPGLDIDPDKLHKSLMDVYHQPSKYTDIIKQLIKRQTQERFTVINT